MNDVRRAFLKYALGFGVVLLTLAVCGLAEAKSSVSLDWDANPDPSVAGYNVYYGGSTRNYTNTINVGNVTNASVGGLLEGQTYHFAVTAYTFDGIESDFSAESVYLTPGLVTLTPGQTPGSPMQIQFPVAVGHWYELQQSTDMVHWGTIWQTMGVSNVWVSYDGPTNPIGAQFYRVVLH